jgi:hypothetical protein
MGLCSLHIADQDHQPHPEATTTNSDYQGAHRSGRTVGTQASRLTLNDMGNASVRDEIPNGAMSREITKPRVAIGAVEVQATKRLVKCC